MAAVTPDVVTLGEVMVVVRPWDDSPVDQAHGFVLGVAGAEANVAVGLARLGHQVSFHGRVGADAAGTRIRRTLRGEGIDVSALQTDPHAPTGLLVRDVAGHRGITVDYHRTGSAGSRLDESNLADARFRSAQTLYVTGLTCALSPSASRAVGHALRVGRDAGVMTVLDPNVRTKLGSAEQWRQWVEPLLALTDLVIASSDELRIITGTRDGHRAVERTRAAGVGRIVLRAGTDPIRILDQDGEDHLAVAPVDPVDPVGAGDAFSAGLLSGLLDGIPLRAAVERAIEVARHCVLVRGDIEGLPTRDQLQEEGDVTR